MIFTRASAYRIQIARAEWLYAIATRPGFIRSVRTAAISAGIVAYFGLCALLGYIAMDDGAIGRFVFG